MTARNYSDVPLCAEFTRTEVEAAKEGEKVRERKPSAARRVRRKQERKNARIAAAIAEGDVNVEETLPDLPEDLPDLPEDEAPDDEAPETWTCVYKDESIKKKIDGVLVEIGTEIVMRNEDGELLRQIEWTRV